MRFKQLTQALADKTKERAAAFDATRAFAKKFDGKTAMTDEERAEKKTLLAAVDALDAELDVLAEDLKDEKRLQALERKTLPVTDAAVETTAQAEGHARIEVGLSQEEKLAKTPGFLGVCMQAVRRHAVREAVQGDAEILRVMAGPSGMSSDVPSDGGFVIAPNWANSLITRTYDVGAILALVDRMTITQGNGMNLPAIDETSRADNSRYGGVTSGWIGQGLTLAAGKPKIRLMELKLRKAAAFVYQTDELIADAPALTQWIEKYVPLELAFRCEDAIVNGDGSNKPSGIINSGAAITVTRNTPSRILYDDCSQMWRRMWAPLRKTAIWMVDQSCEQDLESISIGIGTAGVLAPVYKPAGIAVGPDGTQGYSPATLYGRPILTTEYGANLGTVGDIVLWAPGEYQVIDKGTVEQAVSLHVAFLTDEAVWRFLYRIDGQLKWGAALTPKSAGNTLSPVVTLT